jgi:hypothetical protein
MHGRIVAFTLLCLCALGIVAAQAAEVFTKPTYKGNRLAWCKDWNSECGKGAANAYCDYLGFGEATDYTKDPNIGDKSPTRMIGSGLVCDKRSCDGFKTISCGKKGSAEPDQKSFDKPRWKGYRLDWCTSKNTGCGKNAADAFCKANSFKKATSFNPDFGIGVVDPTRMIGSGAICNTVVCTGFKTIVCTK